MTEQQIRTTTNGLQNTALLDEFCAGEPGGFMDCYVVLNGSVLRVGNSALERSWDLGQSIPTVVSLKNKATNKEWFAAEETSDWLRTVDRRYAFYNSSLFTGDRLGIAVRTVRDDDHGVAREHLKVEVDLTFEASEVRWTHIIYPGVPILRSFVSVTLNDRVEACGPVPAQESESAGLEAPHLRELEGGYQDCFPLEPSHCGWKSVEFVDVTDDMDNLVIASTGLFSRREQRFMKGNLVSVQDHLSKDGLTLIKEGPTALGYLGGVESDFFIKGQNVFTTGWSFGRGDLEKSKTLTTYGSSVVLWSGEETDALSALNEYHGAIHVFDPEKDAFVMSNTWGDQSSDGRLSEQFLLEELEVAQKTGVTLYQIDDGWQNGTTANSINPGGAWGKGYYESNPDFWRVNPTRFPNGLEPIVASANAKGIRMGLWFSPDSLNDFENWEKDSDTLIDLHKQYGISAYKLDGIEFTSKIGEENLTKLMQRVLTGTNRGVFFNMDVTAGVRSGYYGQLQYGSLFLENRFTGKFGGWPNYYPHRTLRNIWMLSRYYPTYRLQAEFLNVHRNTDLYPDDALAPSSCGLEYALAVTLFANPLAWMEQTGLNEESVETLGRVIPRYREVQSEILSGHVLPIGNEPNGTTWTGFQSITSDHSGYLLILKEHNSEPAHSYQLWDLRGKELKLEPVLGAAQQSGATVDETGNTVFQLDGLFAYALYKYTC
ncbi:alpha-galactosidase [Paenarthrobacter sp. AMU7]|uniref:Alpha-galactosidase n=1 Tax=Paenarthrobacter sp. AMU7 TaxID=3162492 RepID=A0AB39YTC3_9MICC